MMRSLTFAPLISPALWVVLAALSLGLWIWYAWSRPVTVSKRRWLVVLMLMAVAVMLPLLLLLNPTWLECIPPPPGKPALTILVDRSASMATPDVWGATNRFQAATQTTIDVATELATAFDVRVRTFADGLSAAELQSLATQTPDGRSTDLAGAISASLGEFRPQGQAIVLLSDGIHHASDGSGSSAGVLDAARLAKAMNAPIYTRTFGGEVRQWDLGVELRTSQALAYVGQNVPVNVRLRHAGLGAANAQISVFYENKEIDRRETPLAVHAPDELTFYVRRDQAGLYRFEVRAAPLPGEENLVNNSAIYLLHVVDEPIRILLLEGKPYWDGKFLARTLTADPAVALDCIVRLAPDRFARRTLSRSTETASGQQGTGRMAKSPTPPGTPDAGKTMASPRLESWKIMPEAAGILADAASLKAYQIVVLGRDAEHFLSDEAITNIRSWLAEEGGSLVCYRGSPTAQINERLDRLLPVRWTGTSESRFRMKLTDEGRGLQWLSTPESSANDAMLTALPSLATAAHVEGVKPLAIVLATATAPTGSAEQPVLTYQRYGSGRVVVIEGAGMWRWAFLAPEFQEQEVAYSAFWHSLLRWLVSDLTLPAGQQVVLRPDRVNFTTTELATATLLVRGSTAGPARQVELMGASKQPFGKFTAVPVGDGAGMFRVVFGKLPEGRYEAAVVEAPAEATTSRTLFDVRALSAEQENLHARPDLMARIARDSEGDILGTGGAEEIARKFKAHYDRTHPERLRRLPAWDRWWVLVGIIGLWTGAWTVRRSGGLV